MTRPRFRPALDSLEARENPASTYTAFGAIAGGAPTVEVVAPSGVVLTQFQAFDGAFAGGVVADTGEIDGDPATIEVAVAAGPGGGPRVQVFAVRKDTGDTTKIADFFAFENAFRDGLRVAVGDIDGSPNGPAQVIVGTDPGGGPRVRAFTVANGVGTQLGTPLGNFFAFEDGFRGGVRVAAGELDENPGDGDELVVAAGPGGGPRVKILRADGTVLRDFYAADPVGTTAGVNVAYDAASLTLRTDFAADDFSQRDERLNAPIRAALAAQAAAQAAGQANGFGASTGTSAGSGFSIGQNGGTSTNSNTGAFGTTQTSNQGAFGTGGAGTGVNGGNGGNGNNGNSNGNALTF